MNETSVRVWWNYEWSIPESVDVDQSYAEWLAKQLRFRKKRSTKELREEAAGAIQIELFNSGHDILTALKVLGGTSIYTLSMLLDKSYSTTHKQVHRLRRMGLVDETREKLQGRNVNIIRLKNIDLRSYAEKLDWQLKNWNEYRKDIAKEKHAQEKAEHQYEREIQAHVREYARKTQR